MSKRHKFQSREWQKINMIWQHSSGMRLHPSGFIRFSGKIHHKNCHALTTEDETIIDKLQLVYGNRRRAMMAFAIECQRSEKIDN
jgi:hypothetical protein